MHLSIPRNLNQPQYPQHLSKMMQVQNRFLFAEADIDKCSMKIGVEKFCYALHCSCSGIVVKIFENTSEGISKK